jgi:hypothetical protein
MHSSRGSRKLQVRAGGLFGCDLPVEGELEAPARIELATLRLGNECSIQLSYGATTHLYKIHEVWYMTLVGHSPSTKQCADFFRIGKPPRFEVLCDESKIRLVVLRLRFLRPGQTHSHRLYLAAALESLRPGQPIVR